MKKPALIAVAAVVVLAGGLYAWQALNASAELKVCTGVKALEATGASDRLTLAPGAKLYAWAKVTGVRAGAVTFVFLRDGKEVYRQGQGVSGSPHRTYTWRTVRAGDGGAWTARLLGPGGRLLASSDFQLEIAK